MPTLPEAHAVSAPPPTWRISLELLDPNPFQARSELLEGPLSELMDGIRSAGLLQPITVRKVPGGKYQVIAGHRRLEAFRRLHREASAQGDKETYRAIPAHEKFNVDDEQMDVLGLQENLIRDSLPPMDAALGVAKFQEKYQLSVEVVAQRMGLELDRTKRLLRLSRAPAVVQDACRSGVLVEQTTDGGEVKRLPSGNPKHERLRLDLMAALEFAKFHAHAAKSSPKKADERTTRAMERALTERWSLRRIQTFCKAALTGGSGAGGGGTSSPGSSTEAADGGEREVPTLPPAATVPLFVDGRELRIRRSRIRTALPSERATLQGLLTAMLSELA